MEAISRFFFLCYSNKPWVCSIIIRKKSELVIVAVFSTFLRFVIIIHLSLLLFTTTTTSTNGCLLLSALLVVFWLSKLKTSEVLRARTEECGHVTITTADRGCCQVPMPLSPPLLHSHLLAPSRPSKLFICVAEQIPAATINVQCICSLALDPSSLRCSGAGRVAGHDGKGGRWCSNHVRHKWQTLGVTSASCEDGVVA